MAVAKVCGIETEYGIHVAGADIDPVAASSLIVSAYKDSNWGTANFDLSSENPTSDARGVNLDDYLDSTIDSKMLNTVLANGARYYVDHAHPEYSSPECRSVRDAVVYDIAGEHILRKSMKNANARLPEGVEISLFKNNSDGKCNSYGCHENFLVSREIPFSQLATMITSHFVSRQIFCGSGKVGRESPSGLAVPHGYQISQRSDFFEEVIGLETTLKRPIVNTRDEPHCDSTKYRRLHVIVGDANMSQYSTFLKMGTTALVLSMIEDGYFPDSILIAHPVHAIKQISIDPLLNNTVSLSDGRRFTALDIQEALCERAINYVSSHDDIGLHHDEAQIIVDEWFTLLDTLRKNPESLHLKVDWIAKKKLVDGYQSRHHLASGDQRLKAIDLMYHALDEQKCLAKKLPLIEIVKHDEVLSASRIPPLDTRAYFRGSVVDKWPDQIVNANWDSIIFDPGKGPLQKVEMNEPLRGTRESVGSIIEQSNTVSDLLARLGTTSDFTDIV